MTDLQALLAPSVEMLGYELVGIERVQQGRQSLLRIYIDSPNGVTIDDCVRVSRQLAAVLDVEDVIAGQYELEVSSPGADRPLFTLAHYQKCVGQKVKLRLRVPKEGRRNFSGTLQQAGEDQKITVVVDGETWIFPLTEIEKANVVPEYE
jgi:ribosome maturation factor RimP